MCVYRVLSVRNVSVGVGGVAGLLVGRSGFYEGVEDGNREYSLGVIEVVVFCEFSMDMEFFYGI